MTDQDNGSQDGDGDDADEDTQYGGSTQDIDATEQTDRREDAVETPDEGDGEGESADEESETDESA